MKQVNIQSIDQLQTLKKSISRFKKVSSLFAPIDAELKRIAERLEEHKKRLVKICRQREDRIRELESTLRSCTKENKDAVRELIRREEKAARENKTTLKKANQIQKEFEEKVLEYKRQSKRLCKQVEVQIPKANRRLQFQTDQLEKYTAIQLLEMYGVVSDVVSLGMGMFREKFATLSSGEKGTWGELAVVHEAQSAGHEVLIAHPHNPNLSGFDCVSMDMETETVHIWESKNFGDTTNAVSERSLTAWRDQVDGEPRTGYRHSWESILQSVESPHEREVLHRAINEGRVKYHLRLGPDTDISGSLREEFDNADVPGATYDWAQYSYQDLLNILE